VFAPGADDAGPGSDTPSAPSEEQRPSARIPGLGPMYQTDDFTWRLHLGPEEGWPPPQIGPADESPDPPRDEPPGGADDHDPLPPGQDPADGHL
jgi:hypothetical protein